MHIKHKKSFILVPIERIFTELLSYNETANLVPVNPHLQSSVAEAIKQSHGDNAAQDAVQSRQKAGGGCGEDRTCVSSERALEDRRSTRQLFQGACLVTICKTRVSLCRGQCRPCREAQRRSPLPPNTWMSSCSKRYMTNVLTCGSSPTKKMMGKQRVKTAGGHTRGQREDKNTLMQLDIMMHELGISVVHRHGNK